MGTFSERFWARHSNPWSGWTRALAMPLLGIGLYLNDYWILGATALFLIVNPILFTQPKSVDNWMSKGTLGEQLYFKDGKKLRWDLPTLLSVGNIPLFALFFYFGWTQQLIPLILSGALVMVIKFWFIDRMAFLYESAVRT